MVIKSDIEKTLNHLKNLYTKATNTRKANYFSKLAVIETCGWIEESIDDIVLRHANKKLNANNIKYYKKSIVKKVHGFSYYNHIRKLFYQLIGLAQVEKLEHKLNLRGDLDVLIAALDILILSRNPLAHTSIKGVTPRLDAPSSTYSTWLTIFPIIKKIESEIKKI